MTRTVPGKRKETKNFSYMNIQFKTTKIYHIMKTCTCNEHPLTPHFYIVKLGLPEYIFFSYFCSKT